MTEQLKQKSALMTLRPASGFYNSKSINTGKTVRVDMAKLIKAVEKLAGETFRVETLIEDK